MEPAPAQPAPLDPTAPEAPAPAAPEPIEETVAPVEESADLIAPLVAGDPEPVEAPYLHWSTSPLIAGATFEVQYRTTTWGGDPSAWSALSTISDCTSSCTAAGDLDADAGDFQITSVGAHTIALDTDTVTHEYRVRPATPPAGRSWTDTAWRTAAFVDGAADLGAFATTTHQALTCTADSFYSVNQAGLISRVTIAGGVATSTAFGMPTNFTGVADALGVGPGGTSMYLISRNSDTASGISAVYQYTVQSGWTTITVPSIDAARYTAGAVSLSDGAYYFAAFGNGNSDVAAIYRVTAAGTVKIGEFDTHASTQKATGDLAFDAEGNLYVIMTTQAGATRVYSVTAAALASANGGTITVASETPPTTGLTGIVGAAFSTDGRLTLGSATAVRRYNPATQAFETGTVTIPASTDLASCAAPSTLTIVKDVVGRIAPADQFTISAVSPSGTTVARATTSGTATGVQAAQAGPVAALSGATYTFTESFFGSPATSYAVGYACVDQDGRAIAVDTSTAGSGRVTIPLGASVECTIRNAPLTGSLTIHKIVEDADGTTREPGAGWSMHAEATATSSTVTLGGTATQTTGTSGSATWGLSFGSPAARASVRVSETQQAGYAFLEGACLVRPIGAAPFVQQITTETGTTLTDVAPGTRIECTFVNRELEARLALAVDVDGDAPASEWFVEASGPTGALAGPAGQSGTPETGASVTPDTGYVLAVSGGRDTYLLGDWMCTDGDDTAVDVDASGAVSVAAGQSVTCIVEAKTSRIVLLKQVVDAAPGIGPDDWTLTATPAALDGGTLPTEAVVGAAFDDAGNPESTFEVRPQHVYTLAEALADPDAPLAYRQVRLEVRQADDSWLAVDAEVTAPEPGETAVYRFVNERIPPVTLPLTGGTAEDAFLIAGGATLLLALLGSLLAQRRRRSLA